MLEAVFQHLRALSDRATGQSRQATGKLPSPDPIFKGIELYERMPVWTDCT